MPKQVAEILNIMGVHKTPVLLSSAPLSLTTMYFSHNLLMAASAGALPQIIGACGFVVALGLLVASFAFYAFAYFRLPASTQEYVFLKEGKAAIERHRKKKKG